MTKRLREICAHIPPSKAFADVGCDHGYCAEYVLKNGLAERVYVTDISAPSLKKAEILLEKYIRTGVCVPIVGDGISCLPEPCTVLIAGMGGEEIVHILSHSIPETFVLQPMKNADKVRKFLVERGCRLIFDGCFEDGKYYDLIVGNNTGGSSYSEDEFAYGKSNLQQPTQTFYNRITAEYCKLKQYASAAEFSEEEHEKMRLRLAEKERIIHEIEQNL